MMMVVVCSSLGWTAPAVGHATAPAVAQRQRMLPVVLKESTSDTDVLMVLVRTLERIEAKIDYLEGKVDTLGAQGLEEKWRIERLEGKVRPQYIPRLWPHLASMHTGAALYDPQPRPPPHSYGCRWII